MSDFTDAVEANSRVMLKQKAEIDRLRAEVERLTKANAILGDADEALRLCDENERLRTLLLKHYLDPDEQVGDAIEELEAERGAC